MLTIFPPKLGIVQNTDISLVCLWEEVKKGKEKTIRGHMQTFFFHQGLMKLLQGQRQGLLLGHLIWFFFPPLAGL